MYICQLAALETLDNGKPLSASKNADVPYVGHGYFRRGGWLGGWMPELINKIPSRSTCPSPLHNSKQQNAYTHTNRLSVDHYRYFAGWADKIEVRIVVFVWTRLTLKFLALE